MISTGTDVKPIECVFFLRNVRSAGFFEQMKGRGVRIISPDKLRAVTPSAKVKDRFIIVDAVGVCEQDKTDSCSLNRKPSATLEELLNYVGQGGADPDALTTLAGRLARLQREFSREQLAELKDLAGGKSLPDLAHGLLNACDPDAQIEMAKKLPGADVEPAEGQIRQAPEQLAQAAFTPFLKASLRRRWEEDQIRKSNAKGQEPPNNRKAKYKEPVAPDTSRLPELPEGWCWVTWAQVGLMQNGRPFPSREYQGFGVRLLRPGNLYANGSVVWTD